MSEGRVARRSPAVSWAVLSLLLAAFCWGFMGPLARFAFARGVTPAEVGVFRSVIGALGFITLSVAGARSSTSRRMRLTPREKIWSILFGCVGVAGLQFSNLQAVRLAGAGWASILLYSAPIWVACVSWAVWRERVGPRRLVALAVVTVGIVGVALSSDHVSMDELFTGGALFYGLFSGVAYAGLYAFGRAFFRPDGPPPSRYYAWTLSAAAVLLTVWVFAHGGFAEKDAVAWSALIACGLVSTLIASAAYGWGVARTHMVSASLICSLEPVVAMAAAWAIWGETMTLPGYVSSAIVLVGIALSSLDAERSAPSQVERVSPAGTVSPRS